MGFWIVGVDWCTVGDSAAGGVPWVSDVVTAGLSIQDLWTSAIYNHLMQCVTRSHLKFLQEDNKMSLNQSKEYFFYSRNNIFSILFQ